MLTYHTNFSIILCISWSRTAYERNWHISFPNGTAMHGKNWLVLKRVLICANQ